MHASFETPFERLRWTSQDIADAVPPRLHEIDLFDAVRHGADASANAERFHREPLRRAYLASAALPARFNVR